MGALIDASVLIAVERWALDFGSALPGPADEPVAMAAITAAELLHGVHRASTAAQRRRREAFVERLLADVPVFPFDLVTARIHASMWAGLAARGASVGPHDLQIAATAVAADYRVVTRDRRGFARIPGLEVIVV
jgi:tRNA(fMet)-specific endonuclease VapC